MNPAPPSDDPALSAFSSRWMATSPSPLMDESAAAPGRMPSQRQPQVQALTPQAHTWLARLPPRYQPLATARRYPHIINRLCELWDTPAALPEHFRELLLSRRPGREGFAFEVLSELADLQSMLELIQKGEQF